MAQNITLLGASYSSVPAVTLPKTGGGTAQFDDTTDANATASDIASGKTAYVNGVKLTGTSSGGGGGSDELDAIIARTISAYTNSTVTKIGTYAFAYCSSLTTVSFPNVTSIGSSAFYTCSSLATVSFPSATYIGSSAFYSCSKLTTASFPSAISIGSYAFGYCSSLATVNFPNVTSIGTYAFYTCPSLATANFPSAISIGSHAFGYCPSLTTASFPMLSRVNQSTFRGCTHLMSLYLLSTSVTTLSGTNAFSSTPMIASSYTGAFGSIYVPASLVSTYKSATNWATFSARITSYNG